MFQRKDWLIGVVSIIIGVAVLFGSREWGGMTALDPAGPAAVPSILAWAILFIGIIHIIAACRISKETEDANKKGWLGEYMPVLKITLICATYNLLLSSIGYLLMTPLLIIGIMWVFNVRDSKTLIKTSLLATMILFTVFHYGLSIRIPMGLLENLIK